MGRSVITPSELRDAAQKAFPGDVLAPDRDASWASLVEMGWLLIDLPEEFGGLGLGRDATTAIHVEMGRVLSRAPLIPALLGLQAIAASSSLPNKQDWIDRICGGAYVPLHMLPAKVEGREALTGTITGVFDADMASYVVAQLGERHILVPLDCTGVRLIERTMWDETRRVFDIELDGFVPEIILAKDETAKALHDAISANAQLALAADALGGAQAALSATVEYLGLRKQFDRPLAMFQALKHRVADLRIGNGTAEALLWSCAKNAETSITELGAMKAFVTDNYRAVTEEMIQLHGGIGLTQEHPCHLFMKRAMLNLHLCGSPDYWHEARGREMMKALSQSS